jgi:hypothetical protein
MIRRLCGGEAVSRTNLAAVLIFGNTGARNFC